MDRLKNRSERCRCYEKKFSTKVINTVEKHKKDVVPKNDSEVPHHHKHIHQHADVHKEIHELRLDLLNHFPRSF